MMNDKKLSKLQRHVIAKLANLIVNSFGDDTEAIECGVADVRYRALFNVCSDWWFKGIPAIDGEPRMRVAQSAFSRAVWSLVDRGIVTGMALAWCDITSMDCIRWHGGGPTRRSSGYAERPRPQIKILTLTDFGWRVYRDDTGRTTASERGIDDK